MPTVSPASKREWPMGSRKNPTSHIRWRNGDSGVPLAEKHWTTIWIAEENGSGKSGKGNHWSSRFPSPKSTTRAKQFYLNKNGSKAWIEKNHHEKGGKQHRPSDRMATHASGELGISSGARLKRRERNRDVEKNLKILLLIRISFLKN